MRVLPGQNIPFWIRLWDGNPSRYILAHVSGLNGVEQVGSPYTLTYVARGVYIGNGPLMTTSMMVVDYGIYFDSAHTQLDSSYLPASDWVEPILPSPPQLIFLNPPIKTRVMTSKIKGFVLPDVEAQARIQQDRLKGFVNIPKLTGRVSAPEIGESL